MDIVSALAPLVSVTEIGLLTAVARRRSGPGVASACRAGCDSRQQRRANVGLNQLQHELVNAIA